MKQQSSDDEGPLEEEKEVLKLQRQKAKSLSVEDFGLEDIDEDGSYESDRELTLEVRVQFSLCQLKIT
jgi:U3 small nucleolar RNA-associated protein 3